MTGAIRLRLLHTEMGDPIGKALGEAAGLIDSYKKQAEHDMEPRSERREHGDLQDTIKSYRSLPRSERRERGDLQDTIKSYRSLLLLAPATACRIRGYLFNLLIPSVAVLS
jgi:hypothetical protein